MTQDEFPFASDSGPPTIARQAAVVDTRPNFRRIGQAQLAWALRRNIALIGSDGPEGTGEKSYCPTLTENLFQPLTTEQEHQVRQGDGHELGNGNRPGKSQCVWSSSTLGFNIYGYWSARGILDPILRAMRVPAGGYAPKFELRLPIHPAHNPANIDWACRYRGRPSHLATEVKMCEWRRHNGLGIKPDYLNRHSLWPRLPNLRRLALALCPDDRSYRLTSPGQLVKHTLACHEHLGHKGFIVYLLYYDSGDPEIRRELRDLAPYWEADGLRFQHGSVQDVVWRACREVWGTEHHAWAVYCSERYLG